MENIADNMTRDLLGLIVENISGVGQEAYTMELIYDVCAAVVTFTNSDGMLLFLMYSLDKVVINTLIMTVFINEFMIIHFQ